MELVIATIGTLAGIAGAWYAYVAVRDRSRHAPANTANDGPTDGHYDAFIAYATSDEDKATWLAAGLQARGRRVFLARWIDAGLVEHVARCDGLEGSTNGILLFSHATMTEPAIRDDYAAILQRIHNGGRRFVPVLIDAVQLPPYAVIRKPIDLTDPRNDTANLDPLARAIGS